MKSHRSVEYSESAVFKYILPPIILSVSLGIVAAAYSLRQSPPERPSVDRRPVVKTTTVENAPPTIAIRAFGTIAPKLEVTVSAEVAGRITRTTDQLEAGHFVKSGDLLAEIEPTKYQLAIGQLESESKQVEVDKLQLELEMENNKRLMAIAEEDLAIAQRESERVEELYRLKSASASQVDQSNSALMKGKNALEQLANIQRLADQRRAKLQVQLDLLTNRLEEARWSLDNTKIVAPIDGFVTADLVETSIYVQPGTAICKIEDRSSVDVRCNLKTDDLYWLTSDGDASGNRANTNENVLYQAPRAPATVTYRVAGQTFEWKDCFLSRYEGTGVDEKTRTIPCRVEVPNPDRDRDRDRADHRFPTLARGMFVEVHLQAVPRRELLAIPHAALRPNDEVWVVREDVLEIVPVQVARLLESSVLIQPHEKLHVGDSAVASPLSLAVSGMKVRVSESEKTAPVSPNSKNLEPIKLTKDQSGQTTGG